MKKKFTILITAAFMLLTMMARPMTVWGQATDVINNSATASNLGNTGTTSWADNFSITGASGAVYYIHSMGTKNTSNALQWNSNGFLYMTTSSEGNKLKSVTITTTANKNIGIYAQNTAYSAAPSGTALATLAATSSGATYTFESDYTFLALKGTASSTSITNITIEWESASGGDDPTITFSNESLNLGAKALGEEFTTNFTISQSNLSYEITLNADKGTVNPTAIAKDADPTEVTWNYTPTTAGQFDATITATSGTISESMHIYGEVKTLHNVNIAPEIANGSISAEPTQAIEGQYVTLTVTPNDGYELEELTIVDANNTPITVSNINVFQMPDSDVTVSATFEVSSTTEVIDVLNRELTGITGSSYNSWNNKTSNSNAVYAGNSAGGSNSIQLRSNNNNSGIVTTASGGTATKVVITWNTSTTNDRTLNIYGKHTAYSAATDLYNNNDQGTLLGTIVKNTSTELTIDGDYEFIGMRSNSGAMYIDEIRITWATEAAAVAKPTFSPEAGTYPSTQNLNVTISCETEGSTIYYTTDGTDPTNTSTQYTAAIPVTETTTIKAIAYVGAESSSIATATYTIVAPLATMQDIFDAATSTATNVYITFGDWVVSGASTSTAYVTDGTKGFIITNYSGGHGFEEGDILSGTAQCSLNTNLGMARLQNFTSTAAGLTVTKGGEATIADIAMADLTAVNAGALLHYNNLLCTVEGSNYFLSDGTTTLQVYTSLWSGFTSVLSNGNYYNVTGVYHNFNTTKEICPRRAADITTQIIPSLAIDPATAQPFTYVENAGPSYDQMFEVTGTNLTSDDIVATITTGADYFEITNNETYSNSVTVNSGDIISVRMKAGLALGNYAGALTLTNEGAENVVVALSGSVTGQTYNIELDDQVEHGTIAADMTSAPAGVTVTLTATPDAGYEFGEWTVLDDETNEVTVTNNQFTMPASDVLVSATFTAKPTNEITCIVTPNDAALMEASPASAYEGQTVTLTVVPETGYTLTSIVITKTSDGSATSITPSASGDDYTFEMPGYAVTVTATFDSDTFVGSFVKVTSIDALEDGGYFIIYDTKAMNSTLTSGKMGATAVEIEDGIITNPDNSIVWKLKKVTVDNNEYWDLYSEKEGKCCYISSTNSSAAFAMLTNAYYHFNVSTYTDGGFKFQTTAATARGISYASGSNDFRTYANSSDPKIYLYKYTVLTERTITFNGNGGTVPSSSAEEYTQTVYDGIATNLTLNQFTNSGSAFAGWSTTQNGEVEYADGASITVSSDITLYAQWSTAYTAMVDDAIVGGSVLINGDEIVEVAEGAVLNLTYTSNLGYAFNAWNVYKADDATVTVDVTENSFTMPAYDVIVSATFDEVTTYSLVTNANQIVSGKHYIIVGYKESNTTYYAMGYDKGNNRDAIAVTVTGNTIVEKEGVYEFVINGPFSFNEKDSCYTIYDKNALSTGYLYAASSGSNYLKTKTELDANGKWTIGIDGSNNEATIKAQGNYTRNWMQYNSSSNLFSCYGNSQQAIYLYVKDNDTDYEYYSCEISYSGDNIPAGETITIGTGSVMEVTSTFTNTDPANLIIEDGGQLIHDNPVSATIQRNITGYGRSNPSGYQFIASPVKDDLNVDETNLTTSGSYDLYIFDQSQPSKEWRNYKANGFTTIGNGVGYLYANTTNITISFSGELKPSDNDVPVTLAYTDGNRCAGWNLIGNPFACKAYIKGATDDIEAFYRMNGNGDGYDAVVGAINPMEGIFVQANDIDQYFYFTRTAPVATPGKGNLNLEVAQVITSRDARQATDNAIIRFDGGNALEKFSFSEDNAKLYIPQNGKDYAVVSADTQGEMPVYFKAAENGTYSISFSMDNVEFGYLHLIDNKTGNDVDLLQTSSYTFEASTIDYASRFRLVFRAIGNENDSENNDFGFFDANGNFLILGIEGTATLQVMDVTGRVISNETFSGDYSKAINASAGVYMLRLIQGSNVRTQKVVVK